MKGYFAQVRRAGFDIGLSAGKLTKAMVEVLSQLPPEATPSKEVVVQHLGLLGQMSKTRDINAAWNSAKRQVVREHPDRFCLDGKVLRWASAMEDRPREKLSTAGHRKLAALAAKEGMTPDELLESPDLLLAQRREMTARDRLQVRVNDELVLDAGTCEGVSGPQGPETLIRPPETTLFHQVLAYLKAKPDPPKRPSGSMVGREGVAATALTVRWGSYLAVLADHDKPVWPAVSSMETSRISDEEMARINIEASAALADWIDLYRADSGGRLYTQLVHRAVAYLPMPKGTSKLKAGTFATLADSNVASRVVHATDTERLARVRADAERYPSRLFANALVNVAWRNGPVEDIHAGYFRGYPLAQRRVTRAEARELMHVASEGMALGMTVCLQFAMEQPKRSWPEQVLPYGLASMMLVTPSGWTLTEASREVRLPA